MSGDAVETFEVLRTPYGRWVWCPAAGTLTYAKKGRQPDWATPQIRLDAAHNSQGCAVAAAVREHADPHWWAVNIASHS